MSQLTNIAPFIRGCTCENGKGLFVAAVTDDEEKKTPAASADTVEIAGDDRQEDLRDRIAAALRAYKEKSGSFPGALSIRGVGTFRIGGNFDDLSGGPGTVRSGGEVSADIPFDRNAVVTDKVVLVTGGAQGFGEGLVRQLAAAGAVVFIADLNIDGAAELAEELNGLHGRTAALPIQVNVADEDSVRAMFEEAVSRTGGIDICISNAGVLKAGSVKEMTVKDFRFVTDVNYIGYFLCTKYAAPILAAQSRGAEAMNTGPYFTDIIQINSKSGLEGSNKNGAYAGGKFGGIGLTQSFAKELVADHIKVNSICPGNFFDGPLWSDPDRGLFVQYLRAGKVPGAESIEDVKRFYEAKVPMNRGCTVQDVIKAVYYIVEQQYETGQAVPVTGGQVMLK